MFESQHFFILLMQLTPEDLKTENHLAPFIQILIDQLKIEKDAFVTFVDGLHDEAQRSAY